MSRYIDLSPLALALFSRIQAHSSLRPISLGDVLRIKPAQSAKVPNAVQALLNARLITSMRHTVGDTTQTVYWPTGLKPITAPSIEEIRMASEPKNTQLARLILLHGPISGTDLAAKAHDAGMNCPTKNIQGILSGHLTRGEIILKKRDGLNWYMTPTQAEDVAAGRVVSTPASAKQSEAEIPVNESDEDEAMPPADAALLAMANRMLSEKVTALENSVETLRDNITGMLNDWTDIRQALDVATHEEAMMAITQLNDMAARDDKLIHDLRNDVYAAHLVLSQIGKKLAIDNFTAIPAALEELTHALATRALQAEQPTGRLALLLIDSADMTDVEELDTCDIRIAQAACMARIDHGHAARAVVVRILGEARRRVEWKEAA